MPIAIAFSLAITARTNGRKYKTVGPAFTRKLAKSGPVAMCLLTISACTGIDEPTALVKPPIVESKTMPIRMTVQAHRRLDAFE
ncbi:MAG: hypothetical protein KJN72_08630 [Woeseia sp.]|nr:hypothetical protein [Woeseia sp.]